MTSPSPPRTIGVLTSGGDAPGMNAAVRAVVRTALDSGPRGVRDPRGVRGAGRGRRPLPPMTWDSVGGILHRGGTVIGTARSDASAARGPSCAPPLTCCGRGSTGWSSSAATAASPAARSCSGVAGPPRRARRGRRWSPRRAAATLPFARGPRRVHRQRPRRHRHDHRRRHRPAPDHRGHRRHREHRREPPAHLRGRGHGPQLRLPGADGRHRHRGRLGPLPEARPTRRLGGDDVRAAGSRPRAGRRDTIVIVAEGAGPYGNPITARTSRRSCWSASARTCASRSSGTSSEAARRRPSTAP